MSHANIKIATFKKLIGLHSYLVARADLAEAYRYYKVWLGSILSGTLGYYLVMGHQLGVNSKTNLKLSLKRLCRRRGFAWNTIMIGYFCLNASALNYYYTSYILGPKYRALSLIPDDYSGIKRKFVSAYGGRGLALHRIFANEKVQNENLLDLAQQVAFHSSKQSIDESGEIKISKSHVFKWGYGFQYRSPKACDGMPGHCWFTNTDEINNYIKALQIASKRMERNKPKKNKEPKEKAPETPSENDEEPRENVRLGVGMAYGATEDWETRFIKASHNEMAKASLERLEILQLLAKIRRITKSYDENSVYNSFYEYSRSIRIGEILGSTSLYDFQTDYLTFERPFRKSLGKLYNVKYYVEDNLEKYCLCNYYPYYIGAFPQ